jgi:hypothetical protein
MLDIRVRKVLEEVDNTFYDIKSVAEFNERCVSFKLRWASLVKECGLERLEEKLNPIFGIYNDNPSEPLYNYNKKYFNSLQELIASNRRIREIENLSNESVQRLKVGIEKGYLSHIYCQKIVGVTKAEIIIPYEKYEDIASEIEQRAYLNAEIRMGVTLNHDPLNIQILT